MNCVFHAYRHHLQALGLKATGLDWDLYLLMKRFTHGSVDQYTRGGVVPWMIKNLAWWHGLHVTVEHSIWEPGHHLADAVGMAQRIIVKHTDFGCYSYPMLLRPAIYLMNDLGHAKYSERVPVGVPILAIQLAPKFARIKREFNPV